MGWVWWGLAGIVVLVGAACAAEAALEARDRTRYPPPGEMVDVGGRSLHLLCRGAAAGPTVVIEQGAGSPSILWWPVQDKVSAFARVCIYDRAGYLWSDPASRVRSLEDRVADLHALLAGAKIAGPIILVGHSFGGPLTRLYARTYPDAVAGIVLVDTIEESVILRPSSEGYVRKLGYFSAVAEFAARVGVVRLAEVFMTSAPDGWSTGAFSAMKALLARPGFFRAAADDLVAMGREPAVMRSLGGAGTMGAMPLVVITHGVPFPGPAAVLEEGWLESQHRLAALSTRGELRVAERSNHMVQSDQPEIVVEAIRHVVDLARKG